ncbi:hypothetical protein BpHYR1_002914 [Brachionus plicatilis]|uniref:Uncharacterized protein n=1 Tax=Brachionus plicatilis TaxID=10195 RepID=A0A3M7QXN9_BRAPC|nr:hypothetical protein BpHYR1_002914 [Brachionus plicatilis]
MLNFAFQREIKSQCDSSNCFIYKQKNGRFLIGKRQVKRWPVRFIAADRASVMGAPEQRLLRSLVISNITSSLRFELKGYLLVEPMFE